VICIEVSSPHSHEYDLSSKYCLIVDMRQYGWTFRIYRLLPIRYCAVYTVFGKTRGGELLIVAVGFPPKEP
jgi:hypothetical protein